MADNDGKQTWGTLEELLLACAVHRHGTESWNSVSAEIYKRSSNLRSLTANDCRHKYFDLKRRFGRKLGSDELESLSQISTAPWLEELRRIRVDELRRELEQYDLSISSLQSKVKKLEEDRQRNSNENSDLDKIVVKNESISPDRKEISSGVGSGYSEIAEQGRETELNESISESEGGASRGVEELKETSDVQSSASLPRKETSEKDNENQSPGNKDFYIESQPFISFVEILLSQSCGSHFSRRLETQETPEYTNVIKQHIDFEIIRKRIEEGLYSRNNFFRDLLLLINNAKVFYHKRSSEFKSAEELHTLVMKQMKTSSSLKRPIEKSSSKPSFTKPRMSVPVITSRRRTSLAPKPLLLLPGSNKKRDDEDETFGEDDDESVTLKNMNRGRKGSNVNSNKNGRSKKKMKVVETLEPNSATNEKGSSVKKNNGRTRAVKREAAPPSSPPTKRSREADEKEEAVSLCSTRLKKRLRR